VGAARSDSSRTGDVSYMKDIFPDDRGRRFTWRPSLGMVRLPRFPRTIAIPAIAGLIGVAVGGIGTAAATNEASTPDTSLNPTGVTRIVRVRVPGPERIVTKTVQVPGPERIVTKTVQVPGPERIVTKTVPGPTREVLAKVCRDALDTGKGNQDWGRTTMVIIFNDPDNADGSVQTYLKWKKIYEQLMAKCLAQS
jgi:hypothetical protein